MEEDGPTIARGPEHSFGKLFLMPNAVAEGELNLATLVAKLREGIEKT